MLPVITGEASFFYPAFKLGDSLPRRVGEGIELGVEVIEFR